MLFKPFSIERITTGRKTQTRRLVKEGERAWENYENRSALKQVVTARNRVKWEVGRSYAIQPGRGKRAVGRICLTAIDYEEDVRQISEGDARAEGFDGKADFLLAWTQINGPNYGPVWVLHFEVV